MDRTELMRPQAQTKNFRQLRNPESRRNRLPQGRAQPVTQYQRSPLKTYTHTSNIIQTVFGLYKQLKKKRPQFEREQGGHMGGFGERKGKGGMISFLYNLKDII